MINREQFLQQNWRFYLMLEKKILRSSDFVEIVEENYKTYSIEFVSQLREIGSEVDIVMKELAGFNQNEKKNIADYANKILLQYPDIINQKIRGNMITIKPFEHWNKDNAGQSLEWWKAYNNVKHGRIENFEQANLKNVFYSIGALFVLNMFLLKKITDKTNCIDIPDVESKLFEMENWTTHYVTGKNLLMQIVEN